MSSSDHAIPQTLEEAVATVIHESRKPPKALAAEIGVRYGYLLDAGNPHSDTLQFQARLIVPLTLASGNDAIIRFLAHKVGGVFYRVAPSSAMDESTARSLKEFGEYLQAVADAAADQKYTPAEAERVKQQGLEVVEAILSHIDAVQRMAGVTPVVGGQSQ